MFHARVAQCGSGADRRGPRYWRQAGVRRTFRLAAVTWAAPASACGEAVTEIGEAHLQIRHAAFVRRNSQQAGEGRQHQDPQAYGNGHEPRHPPEGAIQKGRGRRLHWREHRVELEYEDSTPA